MSIVTKIRNGTPRSDVHLCDSCRYQRRRRSDTGDEKQACTAVDPSAPITRRIVECNTYYHASQQSLADMKQQAWILRTSASGSAIGFIPRHKYVEKYGEDDADKGLY